MKWSRFIFSIAMLMAAATAAAEDYDHRIQRYRERWAALIPTQFVVQNAGNMGTLSAGIGWNYGKHQQWETDLLVGFIPKHQSTRTKVTFTLKENFLPWSIDLGPKTDTNDAGRWTFEPLQASLYVNTVYGHEFWKS